MTKKLEVSNWSEVREVAEQYGFTVRLKGALLDEAGHEVGYVDMRTPEGEHYRIVIEEDESIPSDEDADRESTTEETLEEIPDEPVFGSGEGLGFSFDD